MAASYVSMRTGPVVTRVAAALLVAELRADRGTRATAVVHMCNGDFSGRTVPPAVFPRTIAPRFAATILHRHLHGLDRPSEDSLSAMRESGIAVIDGCLRIAGKRNGAAAGGRPVARQPAAASSAAQTGRSLKCSPSGRITATRRTSTWRQRRCASGSRSLVCSWALMWVRVVVIGTFFSDRVRLLWNRVIPAEGIPGDQCRRAAAGP
jgi:hypothetical protein